MEVNGTTCRTGSYSIPQTPDGQHAPLPQAGSGLLMAELPTTFPPVASFLTGVPAGVSPGSIPAWSQSSPQVLNNSLRR